MSTIDVTNLKSKVALTPSKFYDKDDKEIGTLCRAWVTFNGVTNAITASFNVSSITDNLTGEYTVNLTNAMPDANYAVAGSFKPTSDWSPIFGLNEAYTKTTTAVPVRTSSYNAMVDTTEISVIVFR